VGVLGASPREAATAEYCWVTDPLDGTRNFAFGVPVFATAIALLHRGRPVMGIVKSLNSGDTFVGVRHQGVTHDGRPVSVGRGVIAERSMVAVQSTIRGLDSRIVDALSGTAALRNLGSTALHMALVASGAFAGAVAWECRLWDVAAGWLLIDEAGGQCTDWSGGSLVPFAERAYAGSEVPFVAAGPESHERFRTRIARVRDVPPPGQA
jgi:myo-inositol-1(or 4)-monophosphatase